MGREWLAYKCDYIMNEDAIMLEAVNLLCMWSFGVWCAAVCWRMLELY